MKNILLAILLTLSTSTFAGWFSGENYTKNIAPEIAVESREVRDNAFVRRCDSMLDKYEDLMFENPEDEYYQYQYDLWLDKCDKYYQ